MIRRYLLDTNVAQCFQDNRGGVRENATRHRRAGHKVGICPPVLGELWAGFQFSRSSERDRNLARLNYAISWFVHWPYSNEAAEEFGLIYAELKLKGRIIQQIDVQIAAIARKLPNCIIVSSDTDFATISGLAVEDWTA